MERFFMPTKVYEGRGCVFDCPGEWSALGKRALIVTGKTSGAKSGALYDVQDVLDSLSICYVVYDNVLNNPTVENAYEAGMLAKEFKADFVIGIGGGSPLDLGKAAALYGANDIAPMEIYDEPENMPLPFVAIPTTAGTGSEVTQYSVLTVPEKETKVTAKGDYLFPRLAFLDSRYTKDLPESVAKNTALDAMSHCIESILSKRATNDSKAISYCALEIIGKYLNDTNLFPMPDESRDALLHAAMLGGMAIAQTGTIVVHSMGYALTFFKDMPHGLANGKLLVPYLRRAKDEVSEECTKIFSALGCGDFDGFEKLISSLNLPEYDITDDEAKMFASRTIKSYNVVLNPWIIDEEQEREMLTLK